MQSHAGGARPGQPKQLRKKLLQPQRRMQQSLQTLHAQMSTPQHVQLRYQSSSSSSSHMWPPAAKQLGQHLKLESSMAPWLQQMTPQMLVNQVLPLMMASKLVHLPPASSLTMLRQHHPERQAEMRKVQRMMVLQMAMQMAMTLTRQSRQDVQGGRPRRGHRHAGVGVDEGGGGVEAEAGPEQHPRSPVQVPALAAHQRQTEGHHQPCTQERMGELGPDPRAGEHIGARRPRQAAGRPQPRLPMMQGTAVHCLTGPHPPSSSSSSSRRPLVQEPAGRSGPTHASQERPSAWTPLRKALLPRRPCKGPPAKPQLWPGPSSWLALSLRLWRLHHPLGCHLRMNQPVRVAQTAMMAVPWIRM